MQDSFFSEWTSSLFMAIGFIIFIHFNFFPAMIFGAFVFSIGITNWPILCLPLFVVLVLAVFDYFFSNSKDIKFIRFISISAIISIGFILFDLYRKGHLTHNPYSSEAEKGFATNLPYSGMPVFGYPVLLGILGSLFSFGKSVFQFNPFLVFLFVEKYKYKKYLIVSFITVLLLYSKCWTWYGGFSFGTRFYTFLIIPSVALFVHHIRRDAGRSKPMLLFIFMFLAMWLALAGKHFGLDGVAGVCTMNEYAFEGFCWFAPEFSPLIHPFISHDLSSIASKFTLLDWSYLCCLVIVFCITIYARSKWSFK